MPFLPRLPFAGLGFLSHNFGFKNATKPIMGSKDSDYSLVSKKMMQRWFIELAPRAR